MKRVDGYPPKDAFCVEAGCDRSATHERPVGMFGTVEVVELVCEDHDTKVDQ